jgi:hypothetical protein
LVERLQRSIAAVERRVVISADMMRHLSGIAHRPDTPYSSFLINDIIVEEYTFLERFSRLKQVTVVLEFGENLPAVVNDPALFQHIFYRVYMLCLEQLDTDQQLIIITESDGTGSVVVKLRLMGNSDAGLKTLDDTFLSAAIQKLKGTLETGEKSSGHSDIIFTIPSISV